MFIILCKVTPKHTHCVCRSYAINGFMKIIYLDLLKSNNVINYLAKMKWGGDGSDAKDKSWFKDMAHILQF